MNKSILAGKEALVNEVAEKLSRAQSSVIVEYRGLSVAKTMELRKLLNEDKVEFKIYKNTIMQRAAEKAGLMGLCDYLTGPNAVAFCDDAVAPSRILTKFSKRNDKLVLKAGVIEGTVVDDEKLKEIAKLPNRDGIISMILGCLQSPLRNFAFAVKSIAEKE